MGANIAHPQARTDRWVGTVSADERDVQKVGETTPYGSTQILEEDYQGHRLMRKGTRRSGGHVVSGDVGDWVFLAGVGDDLDLFRAVARSAKRGLVVPDCWWR